MADAHAHAHSHAHAHKRSTAPIAIGVKAQQHGGGVVGKMSTRSSGGGGGGVSGGGQSSKPEGVGTSRSLSAMAAPSTPAKEMALSSANGNSSGDSAGSGQGTRQNSVGKELQSSTGSWTPGSSSSLCYLSESMRSSDQYAIYDMNHFRYGGASYNGTPSPLIVSSVGQGFSWSRDGMLPPLPSCMHVTTIGERRELTIAKHSLPQPLRTGALRRRRLRHARGAHRGARDHPRRRADV